MGDASVDMITTSPLSAALARVQGHNDQGCTTSIYERVFRPRTDWRPAAALPRDGGLDRHNLLGEDYRALTLDHPEHLAMWTLLEETIGQFARGVFAMKPEQLLDSPQIGGLGSPGRRRGGGEMGTRGVFAWLLSSRKASESQVGHVVHHGLEHYRLSRACRRPFAEDVLIDCGRIEQFGLLELTLTPVERRWGQHDAGAGADAASAVDDDPHCHVTPDLIAYSIASAVDPTPSLARRASTSTDSSLPWLTDPEARPLSRSRSVSVNAIASVGPTP